MKSTWKQVTPVVVSVILIAVGIWGIKVAVSDVRGRGNSIITKNSAPNRIASQERFEKLYAEIRATDQKINVISGQKGMQEWETNYNGLVSYCLGVVADYNALARSYRSEDFRSTDLPYQIDTNNTYTDCKED